MRVWHKRLIPKLCRQHLLAAWREGLGIYSILENDKKGYRNHPAVREFEEARFVLWERLKDVMDEMIRRGYNPKGMPPLPDVKNFWFLEKPWQTLGKQKAVLKAKKCPCKV